MQCLRFSERFLILDWVRSQVVLVCVVQVFANMQDLLRTEESDEVRMLSNIHELATQLYQNVSSTPQFHCF